MSVKPEEIIDLTLKTQDATNPKKLLKKGFEVLEVGLGGVSHGIISSLITGKTPLSQNVQEVLMLLGSMLISGAITDNDAKNIVGGITAASASKLAEELYAKLKGLFNSKTSNINLKTSAESIITQNVNGGFFI